MKDNRRQLQKQIGYRFKNKRLLETALTHPSYRHENKDVLSDNQRLEFLGDAVLDLVVADHLFNERDLEEGPMTELRSNITCTTALAKIASSIDLGSHLIFGRGESTSEGSKRPSNLADGLEAVIGAAYLDGKYKAVKKIFAKLFLPALATPTPNKQHNPKGTLQELCQKGGKGNPVYKLIHEGGPSHARTFEFEVEIDGQTVGRARGSSKSRAEKDAAREALDKLV